MQVKSTFEWAPMKILTNPLPDDQGLAFPNPLSTNHVVRAFYVRAQSHLWIVKNRVPTVLIELQNSIQIKEAKNFIF